MVIQALVQRGVYLCDIAEQLGVHPKTVRRALQRGGPPRRGGAAGAAAAGSVPARGRSALAEGVWNAVVIWRELQAKGYAGGHLDPARLRPPQAGTAPSRATVRFETEPGRQLQRDWAIQRTVIAGEADGRPLRREHAGLLAPLPLLVYRPRTPSTPMRRWSAPSSGSAARPARSWSIIRRVRCWPIPAAATSTSIPASSIWPATTASCPRACRPARAQTKGKDERNVGYVKHHFFVRYRAFESWAHLNQLAEQWLREEADPRVHGTVHEVVAERFAREAPTLQPLPARRYDTAYWERAPGRLGRLRRGPRQSLQRARASWPGQPVRVRMTLDGPSASTTASSASPSTSCSPPPRAGSPSPIITPGSGPDTWPSSGGPWRCTRRWRHGADAPSSSG